MQKRFQCVAKAVLTVIFGVCVSGALADTANPTVETQVWRYANQEDSIEAYELFIFTYPDSDLVAIAEARLVTLKDEAARRESETQVFNLVGPVTFDAPLQVGHQSIIGRSIEEILQSSPAFPPIEGLPEDYWKNETCSNCHEWTKVNLCTQASNYLDQDPSAYQEKMHPFGGTLMVNLRNWAENDCG